MKKNDKKIEFEDIKLQVKIGQWLGLLSSNEAYLVNNIKLFMPLSVSELLRKTAISKEKFKQIEDEFLRLLNSIGIDDDKIIINNYDESKFSFNCHLNDKNEDAKIELSFGSLMDNPKSLEVDKDNQIKTYYYNEPYNNEKGKLELAYYYKNNLDNGNKLFRYLTPYRYNAVVSNGDNTLSIDLNPVQNNSNDKYLISEDFDEKVNELSFPINTKDVLELLSSYVDLFDRFNKIDINVVKKLDDKTEQELEGMYITDGELKYFSTSVDDKIVKYNANGNWSVSSPILDIKYRDKDGGKISYHLKDYAVSKMFSLEPIDKQVLDARMLVQEKFEENISYFDEFFKNKGKVKTYK